MKYVLPPRPKRRGPYKKKYSKVCPCGKSFESAYPKAIFCCGACRMRAHIDARVARKVEEVLKERLLNAKTGMSQGAS